MYRLFRQVHPSLTLAILLTAGLLFPITSHADEGCSWEGIKFTFNPSKKMYLSTLLEHRTNNNFQRTDCYFGRQYVGWKWTPWLKTDAAYEIQKDQESVYHRGMFSATATLKEGNFALSLRERYLYDYSVDRKDGDQKYHPILPPKYSYGKNGRKLDITLVFTMISTTKTVLNSSISTTPKLALHLPNM